MSDLTLKSEPRRRGGWLRKLVWVAAGLAVLLVVAYFVVTSNAFVKGVVLPRVGAALNADLSAGDVQFSPFSQLVIRDVKLTPKGAETLLTASLVRARYSLFSILGGNLAIEEITLESPTVTLLENADGTSNLDPLLKAKSPERKASAVAAAKSSAPPKVDLKSVSLKNATVKRTKRLKDGGTVVLELSNVNVTAANLKNGSPGKLDLAAAIAMNNSSTTNAGSLAAKMEGGFTFDLSPDLKPAKLNGKAAFTV